MGFRGWLTKNAAKVVETTVEQSKQALQKKVGDSTDLYSKLVKLGLMGLLMWLTGKEIGGYLSDPEAARSQRGLPSPTSIVINNYIREKERSDGE